MFLYDKCFYKHEGLFSSITLEILFTEKSYLKRKLKYQSIYSYFYDLFNAMKWKGSNGSQTFANNYKNEYY